MRERHKAELNAQRLGMQQERQDLEARLKEAVDRARQETLASFQPREVELRAEIDKAAKERNEKKLRAVVQKLENDLNQQKKRIIDEADRKVGAAQLEARRAAAAMGAQQQSHQEEVAALKQEILEEKALITRLESENNRLSNEIEQQRQLKGRLQNEITQKESEMSHLRTDIQRREATARESGLTGLRDIQQQLEEAKAELQRQKTAFESEKKKLEETHAAELSAVSTKVKTLIEGKEATIQALKEQLGVAQNRLRDVEQLFHQQKKAIFGAKK
jgi:chromosome segregation ATPase